MKKEPLIIKNEEYIKREENKKCVSCGKALYKRYEGLVCKNSACGLYFKLEKGYIYLNGKRKRSALFFSNKYHFDITNYNNKKEWLLLRSELIYKKKVCEVCKSNIRLEVHHILPRCCYPELTFDLDNLMVLCKNCHKKIHSQEKYRFQ